MRSYRTNRRTIDVRPSVSLSVRPSVCLGRTCIVMMQCTLAQTSVYGWIVQCSRHRDTKACPPTPSRLYPFPPVTELGYGCAS